MSANVTHIGQRRRKPVPEAGTPPSPRPPAKVETGPSLLWLDRPALVPDYRAMGARPAPVPAPSLLRRLRGLLARR